jgi:hypothetical protein
MTPEEIYNLYLSTSRGLKNKPWKPRKDFEGFDKTEQGILCLRLSLFFKRFPQINPRDFLAAPYILYKDEEYFDLKFYLTQKAISCFSLVQKQKQEESPDTNNQIQSIIESVKYIASKCMTENVGFVDYCKRKNGYTWDIVKDYVDNKINLYLLLMLPSFQEMYDNTPVQDKELYFKNFYQDIVKYKMRLNNSVKAKKIITESIKRLSTHIPNNR